MRPHHRVTRFFTASLLMFAGVAFSEEARSAPTPSSNGASTHGACPLVTLRRTTCFGTCPAYEMTIYNDGRVEYIGWASVKACGPRTATISGAAVAALTSAFEQADYFALADAYDHRDVTDNPSAFTSYCDGTRSKSVKHYYGDRSAPRALNELEARVDAIVHTDRWIGNRRDREKMWEKMWPTRRDPCPQIACVAEVPRKFFDPPEGGMNEVGYRTGYEAFWWNCVMLLAEDSRARCPTICTGSPAATAGCRNGGSEAQREARDFTKTYGHERAREVLRSLAADPEAKFKIGPYFDGHVAERELPRTE